MEGLLEKYLKRHALETRAVTEPDRPVTFSENGRVRFSSNDGGPVIMNVSLGGCGSDSRLPCGKSPGTEEKTFFK